MKSQRRSSRRWFLVVACIAILVLGATIGFHHQTTDVGILISEPMVQTTAPISVTLPAPSVTSAVPRPSIRQAIPSRIAIPDIGYQANVDQMTTKANGDVNPPTLQDAYLITNVGTMPGTDAANTAYMACHAWSKGNAPCNLVPQVVAGQHVLVTTPNGTLDYVVQVTKLFSKNGEFKNSDEVRAKVPGRLVLVTCYELNGVSTQNFVVFAQLVTE